MRVDRHFCCPAHVSDEGNPKRKENVAATLNNPRIFFFGADLGLLRISSFGSEIERA